MSRFTRSMALCLTFTLIGLLIVLQADPYGESLISGYTGLRVAAIICLVAAIVMFFSALVHSEHDIQRDTYSGEPRP